MKTFKTQNTTFILDYLKEQELLKNKPIKERKLKLIKVRVKV
jgi:hypothetical protein